MRAVNVLISGGAGFIGSNLAHRLLRQGAQVSILDNLSRKGVESNLKWLTAKHANNMRFVEGDIRDLDTVEGLVSQSDIVYHLAAQTAVTVSVSEPLTDFDVNARGTLNVLEATRHTHHKPIVVFASTNKVYGAMDDIPVAAGERRYSYQGYPCGIPETRPLDFHSPYGCSKGAADQYVRDYARIYGLRTVVFRQSCVYGPRQLGTEDQGWVAWFMIAALCGRPVTIYGDGKQVRDVLYIEDLLDAYQEVVSHIDATEGEVYNIGGGPTKTISVWDEFGPILSELHGQEINVHYADWRPGDQRVYISDIRKAKNDFGWEPQVNVREGFKQLYEWLRQSKTAFV